MNDLNIKDEPMVLRGLLRDRNIRLWQVIRRLASKGIRTTEPRLSRVLNRIEEPPPDLARELKLIQDSLIGFDYEKKKTDQD